MNLDILSSPAFALAVNAVVVVGGALTHHIKKRIRNQTTAGIREYLFSHPLSVLTAFGAAGLVFIYSAKGFMALGPETLTAALTLGWTADSAFNTSDGDARVDVNVGEKP